MKLLKPLIHPACFDDESPVGYLQRLAIVNHYPTYDWLVKSLPKNITLPELSEVVSQSDWPGFWAGSPFNDLSRLSYLYFQTNKIHICPYCVEEKNYWEYKVHAVLSQVCIKHRCWKIDTCQTCKKPFAWRSGRLSHCVCGAKRTGLRKFPSPKIVELAAFLEGENLPGESSLNFAEFTYKERCDLFMLFARNLNSQGRMPRLDSIAVSEEYWMKIADLLIGGLEQFHQFLVDLHDRRDEDFRDFYRKFQAFNQRCLSSHREVLLRYISGDLRVPITKQHRSLFKDKPDNEIWLALQTVARHFLVPKSTLRQLIESGRIIHQTRQRKRGELVLIYIQSPEAFQKFLENYICLNDAAMLLGVTLAQLRTLIEHGHISDVCRPDGKYVQWLISATEIEGLKTKLSLKITSNQCEILKFADALSYYSIGFNELITEMLSAILSDQITIIEWKGDKFLRDICLDREEFLAWRKQKLAADGTLSIVDLAKRFNINQESLYQIVNAGLIRSVDGGKNRMNRHIPEEAIDEFKNKYALLSKIAWAMNGSSPTKMKEGIEWYGVKPIGDELGIELRQTIYLRSDLIKKTDLGYMLNQKGDWSFDKGSKTSRREGEFSEKESKLIFDT